MLKLNKFLRIIKLKKQYLKKLKENFFALKHCRKNYKKLNSDFKFQVKKFNTHSFFVTYIISIVFSKTNSLFHIMDFSGKLKFFYSAGSFSYSGKSKKKARFLVFKKFYQLLVKKFKFLRKTPVALHLTNVESNKTWIVKKLKKKIFIKVIRIFNSYPHNGCRKKKVRRIKVRTPKPKRWLSGLRRQTVNLLSFSSQVRILLSSYKRINNNIRNIT